MCPHGEPIACPRCGDDAQAAFDRILRAYRMYDRFRDYNSLFALLDVYRAVGKSIANMTSLIGEPPPPETVRKIMLELGFTHPVEAHGGT